MLSLDAPVVAIVWQLAFAGVANVPLGWPHVTVLAASVWLAYTADRWLEARRLGVERAATVRHRFYARHRRAVAAIWVPILVTDIAVAFGRLARAEIIAGAVLLVAVLCYVLSHQLVHRHSRWRPPKELMIAVLMASGVVVFIIPRIPQTAGLAAATALFASLCFVNVALIALWERPIDLAHGQASLATDYENAGPAIHGAPLVLAGVAGFAAIPLFGIAPAIAHCVAASAVLLALIDRFQPSIGWRSAHVLADAALLTPLLPLVRGWCE